MLPILTLVNVIPQLPNASESLLHAHRPAHRTMSAPPDSTSVAPPTDDDDLTTLSSDLLEFLSPEARAALEAHRHEKAEANAKAAQNEADGATEIGEDFGMSQVSARDRQMRASVESRDTPHSKNGYFGCIVRSNASTLYLFSLLFVVVFCFSQVLVYRCLCR